MFAGNKSWRCDTRKLSLLMAYLNSKAGGGATGTIRPSTSPRMRNVGFEVRASYGSARPRASVEGCSEFERRGRHAGFCCSVHARPWALLSRLLSKDCRTGRCCRINRLVESTENAGEAPLNRTGQTRREVLLFDHCLIIAISTGSVGKSPAWWPIMASARHAAERRRGVDEGDS